MNQITPINQLEEIMIEKINEYLHCLCDEEGGMCFYIDEEGDKTEECSFYEKLLEYEFDNDNLIQNLMTDMGGTLEGTNIKFNDFESWIELNTEDGYKGVLPNEECWQDKEAIEEEETKIHSLASPEYVELATKMIDYFENVKKFQDYTYVEDENQLFWDYVLYFFETVGDLKEYIINLIDPVQTK